MLLARLRWLSIAARGAPAVPLVNIITANESPSISTMGRGVRGQQLVEHPRTVRRHHPR